MAKAKSWALTDLSSAGTLYLDVEGQRYEVVQFSSTFALNEIPKAHCLLAIGRDARNGGTDLASVHESGEDFKQMKPARVTFAPKEEWNPDGTRWQGSRDIFVGYTVGLVYRKVSGKVQAIAHLTHWLVDLTFSSVLSKNQHPTNPTSLVHPAVVPATQGTGGGGQPVYVSHLVAHEDIKTKVQSDLWEGIKTMLCELADLDKFEIACQGGEGPGDKKGNDRAKRALQRIQGPGKCNKPYDPVMGGMPLALEDEGIPLVKEAVADAVTNRTMNSAAASTFWDMIVRVYNPMFGMAIVPQVEDATVIADTPALDQAYDKELTPEDYVDFSLTGQISKPLQGVGVYGDYAAATKWAVTERGGGDICLGGHFAADAEEANDGAFLVVPAPPWLQQVSTTGRYAGSTTGLKDEQVTNTSTTPQDPSKPEDPAPGEVRSSLAQMYDKFAHTIYVANMLRGRGATISSKLRFDIAPGSIVKIGSKPELFSGGVDELATDLYGHVVRVSVNINAEGGMAGTTFQLNHIRTKTEFEGDERTKVSEHPLFGSNVYKGSPLVKVWKFDE